MSDDREPEFWSCDRDEGISPCESIKEAVEDFVENHVPPDHPIPETVTVYGFAPMPLSSHERLVRWLEAVIGEGLDEEYSYLDDPNSGFASCHKSRQKLDELVQTLRREYPVYWCEPVGEHTVRVRDYVHAEMAPAGAND